MRTPALYNASLYPNRIVVTRVSSHRSKISSLWQKGGNADVALGRQENCKICDLYSTCKNRVKNIDNNPHPALIGAKPLPCYKVVNEHQGKISDTAGKKMQDSILWLFSAAKVKMVYESKLKRLVPWRINFCTLTIKAGQAELNAKGFTDQKLKNILNAWLSMARYRFGLKSYVWKAETQKRDVLHFHLTTDCYMHWRAVRQTWNDLLAKHGLAQPDANSTDIHAVVDVVGAMHYLNKYFNKNESNKRIVNGRLWSRSHTLAQLHCRVQLPEEEITEFTNQIKSDLSCREVGLYDYATIYWLRHGYWENCKHEWDIKKDYDNCCNSIVSHGQGIRKDKKKIKAN